MVSILRQTPDPRDSSNMSSQFAGPSQHANTGSYRGIIWNVEHLVRLYISSGTIWSIWSWTKLSSAGLIGSRKFNIYFWLKWWNDRCGLCQPMLHLPPKNMKMLICFHYYVWCVMYKGKSVSVRVCGQQRECKHGYNIHSAGPDLPNCHYCLTYTWMIWMAGLAFPPPTTAGLT